MKQHVARITAGCFYQLAIALATSELSSICTSNDRIMAPLL